MRNLIVNLLTTKTPQQVTQAICKISSASFNNFIHCLNYSDLQECRTTSLLFNPISSDSSPEMAVEFEVIRRSTNGEAGFK